MKIKYDPGIQVEILWTDVTVTARTLEDVIINRDFFLTCNRQKQEKKDLKKKTLNYENVIKWHYKIREVLK